MPQTPVRFRYVLLLFVLVFVPGLACQAPIGPPPDDNWLANATLKTPKILTIDNLGACQGVSLHEGKIYLYGDVYEAKPRVGVIREYNRDLKPTGRVLWLKKKGQPLLLHPTGLTWDEKWGCFLGDTVDQKAKIYRLDWERAWKDGNLDHAVLDVVTDDAAVNGCRPLFVTVGGKKYLATADYGDVRPEIRLYDPAKLLQAKRSSVPGVIVHRILAGPFNQNLAWDEKAGHLICVQNVIAGRGFRLDYLNLARAVADGRASGPGVRVKTVTLPPHTELEGFRMLDKKRGIYVTAHRKDNVIIGEIIPTKPQISPKGEVGFELEP